MLNNSGFIKTDVVKKNKPALITTEAFKDMEENGRSTVPKSKHGERQGLLNNKFKLDDKILRNFYGLLSLNWFGAGI
jgi:hypothetical protein|tara:strand:- start:248 stop:478 length:231 start_codon:yes stop_codon:yes gene_type:complete